MSFFGKISSKIIIIFILVFVALSAVVFTSYLAIDTQKQHIAITEIIAAERIAVERITNITADIAKSKLGNNTLFIEDTDQIDKVIHAQTEIDAILKSLYKKEYRLINGQMYQLRFRGEFENKLYEKVDEISIAWNSMKMLSTFLIDLTALKIGTNILENIKSLITLIPIF